MTNSQTERILGRRGARVLTTEEVENITGGFSTQTTRISSVAGHPDLLADSD
jgi:hypothetical protein